MCDIPKSFWTFDDPFFKKSSSNIIPFIDSIFSTEPSNMIDLFIDYLNQPIILLSVSILAFLIIYIAFCCVRFFLKFKIGYPSYAFVGFIGMCISILASMLSINGIFEAANILCETNSTSSNFLSMFDSLLYKTSECDLLDFEFTSFKEVVNELFTLVFDIFTPLYTTMFAIVLSILPVFAVLIFLCNPSKKNKRCYWCCSHTFNAILWSLATLSIVLSFVFYDISDGKREFKASPNKSLFICQNLTILSLNINPCNIVSTCLKNPNRSILSVLFDSNSSASDLLSDILQENFSAIGDIFPSVSPSEAAALTDILLFDDLDHLLPIFTGSNDQYVNASILSNFITTAIIPNIGDLTNQTNSTTIYLSNVADDLMNYTTIDSYSIREILQDTENVPTGIYKIRLSIKFLRF